jgi:PAS domain S-box-containing protein
MLPDAYGLISIQKIKDEFKNIPVIILSGITDREIAAKAIEIGAQEFVVKLPFEPDMFSRLIQYSIIRQKNEDRLRKSDELFSTILDNTDALLIVLDADLNFIFVNKAYSNANDHPQSYFIGKKFFEIYSSQEMRENITEVLTTKKTTSKFLSPFFDKNRPEKGFTYWYWTFTPILDKDGNLLSILLSAKDVTSKAEYENKITYQTNLLAKERDKFKTILNSSLMLVVEMDTEQNILFLNKKACTLLECQADDFVGENWFDNFIPAEIREDLRNKFHQFVNKAPDALPNYKNNIVSCKGTLRMIFWNNIVITNEKGEVESVFSTGFEV